MIVPTPVPFANIPVAGVYSSDLSSYWMKTDPTTAVDLANGHVVGSQNPATAFYYFPGASLLLG